MEGTIQNKYTFIGSTPKVKTGFIKEYAKYKQKKRETVYKDSNLQNVRLRREKVEVLLLCTGILD